MQWYLHLPFHVSFCKLNFCRKTIQHFSHVRNNKYIEMTLNRSYNNLSLTGSKPHEQKGKPESFQFK